MSHFLVSYRWSHHHDNDLLLLIQKLSDLLDLHFKIMRTDPWTTAPHNQHSMQAVAGVTLFGLLGVFRVFVVLLFSLLVLFL